MLKYAYVIAGIVCKEQNKSYINSVTAGMVVRAAVNPKNDT